MLIEGALSFSAMIYRTLYFLLLTITLSVMAVSLCSAQQDSLDKVKRVAEDALIRSSLSGVRMTIQNVDITKFPLVKLIVEVLDDSARAMESLDPSTLTVVENGVTKTVIGVEKITISERIPVDFMFIVDITGTMQSHINGVKDNIEGFVDALRTRGIEYRLGLVLFSDFVERSYQPTSDVKEFLSWLCEPCGCDNHRCPLSSIW